VPLMRLLLTSAAVTLPLLISDPAIAFCSKPIGPSCANDDDLSGRYVSRVECRRQVEDHLEDLTDYKLCRRSEIEQLDRDIERFRALLEQVPRSP